MKWALLGLRMGPPLSFSKVEGLLGDGCRLQLKFLYLREPPLWLLGPSAQAPHLLLLAPSPVPTQTPIHPAAGQELYIEPCRQAMARD